MIKKGKEKLAKTIIRAIVRRKNRMENINFKGL